MKNGNKTQPPVERGLGSKWIIGRIFEFVFLVCIELGLLLCIYGCVLLNKWGWMGLGIGYCILTLWYLIRVVGEVRFDLECWKARNNTPPPGPRSEDIKPACNVYFFNNGHSDPQEVIVELQVSYVDWCRLEPAGILALIQQKLEDRET